MGGGGDHGHGGHHEPFKVPDYRIYKWQEYPDLVKHQQRLGQLGLSDPWIRNYCHCFDSRRPLPYTSAWRRQMWHFFAGRSFFIGIAMAATLILVEEKWLYPYLDRHNNSGVHKWEMNHGLGPGAHGHGDHHH